MSIERISHQTIAPDLYPQGQTSSANAAAAGNAAASTAMADSGNASSPSAVLQLQFPEGTSSATASVYSDPSSSSTASSASDAEDQARMAQNHQQALARQAGSYTALALGQDGVLVAKSQSSLSANQSEFVTRAVSALREFSDQAEQLKQNTFDANARQAEANLSVFSGLQKFAARLNVFA